MMFVLSGSVGRTGRNQLQDVRLIQQLLNRVQPSAMRLLTVDGRVSSTMLAAIESFQKQKAIKPAEPDISPAGPTFKSLCGGNPALTTVAWGAKVEASFKTKVLEIADFLQTSADFLMAAMAFETGETFSPSITNRSGSGAVGLIQFMPKVAEFYGTSSAHLSKMNATQQLDYVQKYLATKKDRLQTLQDVYMAIIYPIEVGKGPDTVMFTTPSANYRQNKGLDHNSDGRVTVEEAASLVRAKYTRGVIPGHLG